MASLLLCVAAFLLYYQFVNGQCIAKANGLPVTLSINQFGPPSFGSNALSQLGFDESFGVKSGTSFTPNSISVNGDNLEIGGTVTVSGSMPFLGTIAINGPVATAGQGSVVYNTAQGSGLTTSGCGLGLASNTGFASANNCYN